MKSVNSGYADVNVHLGAGGRRFECGRPDHFSRIYSIRFQAEEKSRVSVGILVPEALRITPIDRFWSGRVPISQRNVQLRQFQLKRLKLRQHYDSIADVWFVESPQASIQ